MRCWGVGLGRGSLARRGPSGAPYVVEVRMSENFGFWLLSLDHAR
jgi:hypothetical protein